MTKSKKSKPVTVRVVFKGGHSEYIEFATRALAEHFFEAIYEYAESGWLSDKWGGFALNLSEVLCCLIEEPEEN